MTGRRASHHVTRFIEKVPLEDGSTVQGRVPGRPGEGGLGTGYWGMGVSREARGGPTRSGCRRQDRTWGPGGPEGVGSPGGKEPQPARPRSALMTDPRDLGGE